MNLKYSSAWYQEPWVWLNGTIFICACAAACLMTYIAIRYSPAEMSPKWYQDGPLIKHQRDNLISLSDANITAQIKVVGRRIEISVLPSQKDAIILPSYQNLNVYIEHPVKPSLDQTIKIERVSEGFYVGFLPENLRGKRYIMVHPESNEWRLVATGHFPQSHAIALRKHLQSDAINE